MSNPALTDKHVLGRQYADDRNLRARQRLWEISRSEPGLDALADYVASSGDHFGHTLPSGRTWQEVVEAVRTTAAEAIAAKGALTVTSKVGAFICR